jgi:hypothetical protein
MAGKIYSKEERGGREKERGERKEGRKEREKGVRGEGIYTRKQDGRAREEGK